jgi:hypothetical protein
MRKVIMHLAAMGVVAAISAGQLSAQIPDASGIALGLGDNYTALARGRNAVAWNPAGLGMPGNPGFSLSFIPLRGIGAIGPISPKDLKLVGDRALTDAEKQDWLERITAQGGQKGSLGADITYLSFNVGPLGLQLSSSITGGLDLGPDAAELLLYGNAGRTGNPRTFAFDGSSFTMAATSTAALSYGMPLNILPDQDLAVGVTVKYTVGHAIFDGRDAGTTFGTDPLEARISFPVLHTDTAFDSLKQGGGYGLDIGAAWRGGPLELGFSLQNLINTFSWDEESLFYRSGSAILTAASSESEFDAHPIASAPAEIRERARELADGYRYRPHVNLGAAYHPSTRLTLVGEVKLKRGEMLNSRSASHLGVGAEFRPLSWLPLRGGYTLLSEGNQLSAGIGFEFGLLNLQLSGARRSGDAGEGGIGMFVFSFGGR